MSNEHRGKCRFCREWVEAGEGVLQFSDSSGWFVAHPECNAQARKATESGYGGVILKDYLAFRAERPKTDA